MTGEDFATKCWRCLEVRQHIIDQARRRAKHDRAVQEEYVQEAWLAISMAPHCLGVENCKHLAGQIIYSSYWQENKARLIRRNPGFIGNVDDEDGWTKDQTVSVKGAPFHMDADELSLEIAEQLVKFLLPVLERMGWRQF
ncbi:MAG: hypothetical protein LLG08_00595 [Actinomycetia bacterium]|nr:hypothetical protein [Actinomycetes bacterium]